MVINKFPFIYPLMVDSQIFQMEMMIHSLPFISLFFGHSLVMIRELYKKEDDIYYLLL